VDGVKVPGVPLIKVPLAMILPASVKVILEAIPADVIVPATSTVPDEIRSSVYRDAVPAPARAMDPAVNDPPPTLMVVFRLLAAGTIVTIGPDTANELVPSITMPLAVLAARLVIAVQLALLTFTVTMTPALIVIVSAATGTAAPPHVAVELQLPDTLAVLAAANAEDAPYVPITNNSSV